MSPSSSLVIDEKLLDSYRDLTKKVKDVKTELVKTADEIEMLFSKMCQEIVRQDLQHEISKIVEQCEQFPLGKSSEEMPVKLPQDYERNLHEMRDLSAKATKLIKEIEELDSKDA